MPLRLCSRSGPAPLCAGPHSSSVHTGALRSPGTPPLLEAGGDFARPRSAVASAGARPASSWFYRGVSGPVLPTEMFFLGMEIVPSQRTFEKTSGRVCRASKRKMAELRGPNIWGPQASAALSCAWCPLLTPTQILKAFLQILRCWSGPALPPGQLRPRPCSPKSLTSHVSEVTVS